MELKYAVIIPPEGGIIAEIVHNNDELQGIIEKYCGFDRILANTPLGLEYMVYATSRKQNMLPANISLSWIIGGGVSVNVVDVYYGYGVICRWIPGNSTFEDSVVGFDAKEFPEVISRLQKLIPKRVLRYEDEVCRT